MTSASLSPDIPDNLVEALLRLDRDGLSALLVAALSDRENPSVLLLASSHPGVRCAVEFVSRYVRANSSSLPSDHDCDQMHALMRDIGPWNECGFVLVSSTAELGSEVRAAAVSVLYSHRPQWVYAQLFKWLSPREVETGFCDAVQGPLGDFAEPIVQRLLHDSTAPGWLRASLAEMWVMAGPGDVSELVEIVEDRSCSSEGRARALAFFLEQVADPRFYRRLEPYKIELSEALAQYEFVDKLAVSYQEKMEEIYDGWIDYLGGMYPEQRADVIKSGGFSPPDSYIERHLDS